jgi:hypothetical protein
VPDSFNAAVERLLELAYGVDAAAA